MAMYNRQPISREDVGPLLVQPVQRASLAFLNGGQDLANEVRELDRVERLRDVLETAQVDAARTVADVRPRGSVTPACPRGRG